MNIAFATPKLASASDGKTQRVVVLKEGLNTYAEDGSDSSELTLTAENGKKIEEAFNIHGVDLPIDYEHGILNDKEFVPAAGWIKSLEFVEDEGLVAEIEWTDKAQKRINDKEVKYLSPFMIFDSKTKEITELVNIGLTILPATQGALSLVANRMKNIQNVLKEADMPKQRKKANAETLLEAAEVAAEVLDEAAVEEVVDTASAIDTLKNTLMEMGVEFADDYSADDVVLAAVEKLTSEVAAAEDVDEDEKEDLVASLRKALKIKKSANLLNKVEELKAHVGFLPVEEHSKLQKRLLVLETEKNKRDADILIASYLKKKILHPDMEDQMEWATKLAAKDPKALKEALDWRKPYAPEDGQLISTVDVVGSDREVAIKNGMSIFNKAERGGGSLCSLESAINVELQTNRLNLLSKSEIDKYCKGAH